MDPITLAVLSSGALYIVDKWRTRRAAAGGGSLENFTLPSIGPAEVESFTSVIGGQRHLDRVVSDGLPGLCLARSAVPIPTGPVSRVSPAARVYRVMPLAMGAPLASDIITEAHGRGETVLASLSVIGLGWGSTDAMLLVVGGPELLGLAAAPPGGPRGDFAVVDKKIERVVVAEPAAVVSETPAPASPVVSPVVAAVTAAAPAAPTALVETSPASAKNGQSKVKVEGNVVTVMPPTEDAKP